MKQLFLEMMKTDRDFRKEIAKMLLSEIEVKVQSNNDELVKVEVELASGDITSYDSDYN